MNWSFNQNCQLVIDEIPSRNDYKHLLEVLFYADGSIETIVDRDDTFVKTISDGLHVYRYLLTDADPSTIDISKIPLYSNSTGGWNGEENIFSICNLRKCTLEKEKQSIEEFLSTCNKRNCNKKSSEQSVRDTLLIAIFVLENLIGQQKYTEAERILKSLGSCVGLCGDDVIKTCNCNG